MKRRKAWFGEVLYNLSHNFLNSHTSLDVASMMSVVIIHPWMLDEEGLCTQVTHM